jgi:hypothetical protein
VEVSGAREEEITRNGRRSPIESPRERGTNRKLANVVMRGERLKKGRQGRLARGGGVRAATLAGWEDGSEGCGHGCGSARPSPGRNCWRWVQAVSLSGVLDYI